MNSIGLGIDIVEVSRFAAIKKNPRHRFLLNNFSRRELAYCLAFSNAAAHLAGTFAAKEAVFKARGQKNLSLAAIEIRRTAAGRPTVWIKNKRQAAMSVSISYVATIAVAVAVKI